MKTAKPSSRRNFLVAAGLGGATAVAATVTARKVAGHSYAPAADGKKKGYHVSDHILKYYKTTQV